MTKYTATFKDGRVIVKTSEEFKNRLDFYNWICINKLGAVESITCSAYIK